MGKTQAVVIELSQDWWKKKREAPTTPVEKVRIRRPVGSITNTKFLTVKETAEKLCRGYFWVLKEIRHGRLVAQPMPRGYIISECAIDDYLKGLREDCRSG